MSQGNIRHKDTDEHTSELLIDPSELVPIDLVQGPGQVLLLRGAPISDLSGGPFAKVEHCPLNRPAVGCEQQGLFGHLSRNSDNFV